ncbi:MAG: LytTR family DNA-binding domain-containing protein [Bacteroidota bacterium]
MKCLIVDDEPLAIKVLETHISNIPSLYIEGTCENAFAAMDFLKTRPVDLMFLDIRMPKLMGHEFLRTFQNRPKVIFTTAYKEYALDAFELDVVDFLLKPITLERLLKSLNKINNDQFTGRKEEPSFVKDEGFVYLRADRKMVKVTYTEILYIESMRDYIKVVRVDNKPLLIKQPISSMEAILPGKLFLRIHRSYIVPVQKISAFTQHEVEINGLQIPVGRLYTGRLSEIIR